MFLGITSQIAEYDFTVSPGIKHHKIASATFGELSPVELIYVVLMVYDGY